MAEQPLKSRVTTMRLTGEQIEALDLIGRVEGASLSSLTREAVDALIAARHTNPTFRARLAATIARDKALLTALEDS